MKPSSDDPAPRPFRFLGFAGLLPPALLVGAIAIERDTLAVPMLLAVTIGYAALIFSFVGGAWWGLLAASGRPIGWGAVAISVAPSLLALGLLLATMRAPVAAPLLLAALIAASPLIDRDITARGFTPSWWMSLRVSLSFGLGALTAAAVLIARP